jgi:tetratricopeptide (TPR) repeat protein
MRRTLALALPVLLAASVISSAPLSLEAQRLGPQPPRPKSAVADTNDARAYFDYGVEVFEADPQAAASAFYWAARIDPGMADALYARRAAVLMTDPSLRWTFLQGGRRARDSKQLRALDSLYLRALNLNPLLFRRLDKRLLTAHIVADVERQVRHSGGNASRSEIDFFVDGWLKDANPEFRAWISYGDGHFKQALSTYAHALKSAKFKAGIRIERGRIFGMTGQLDSAVAELRLALAEMRSRDTKDLVFFYDSKALFEHTIATLLEQQDSVAAAREAYGKALQENLAFYPAHMRLGLLALGQADTATALSELDLAVQIAGDEPFLRYIYGWSLAAARKNDDALVQLKKAVELEPYYAAPYVVIGQLAEQGGDGPAAQVAYKSFLARASQKDTQRAFAQRRLDEVTEFLKGGPPKSP